MMCPENPKFIVGNTAKFWQIWYFRTDELGADPFDSGKLTESSRRGGNMHCYLDFRQHSFWSIEKIRVLLFVVPGDRMWPSAVWKNSVETFQCTPWPTGPKQACDGAIISFSACFLTALIPKNNAPNIFAYPNFLLNISVIINQTTVPWSA